VSFILWFIAKRIRRQPIASIPDIPPDKRSWRKMQ